MSKIRKLLLSREFGWLNIFIRDIILVGLLFYLNIRVHTYWVGFITGMLVVWISWHFSDFINFNKRIKWKSR